MDTIYILLLYDRKNNRYDIVSVHKTKQTAQKEAENQAKITGNNLNDYLIDEYDIKE